MINLKKIIKYLLVIGGFFLITTILLNHAISREKASYDIEIDKLILELKNAYSNASRCDSIKSVLYKINHFQNMQKLLEIDSLRNEINQIKSDMYEAEKQCIEDRQNLGRQ